FWTFSDPHSYEQTARCDSFAVKASPNNDASDLIMAADESLSRKEVKKDGEDAGTLEVIARKKFGEEEKPAD
ncbi:MAG: hypothetical protein LQ352_006925, partial [Teloschistes flavicans]